MSCITWAWRLRRYEHPLGLGDPTRDGGHSLYQALPLLPGIWIARLLAGPGIDSLLAVLGRRAGRAGVVRGRPLSSRPARRPRPQSRSCF